MTQAEFDAMLEASLRENLKLRVTHESNGNGSTSVEVEVFWKDTRWKDLIYSDSDSTSHVHED